MPDETDLPALARARPSRRERLDGPHQDGGSAAATCGAATHPWMGKPLGSYSDAELAVILSALDDVAFGSSLDRGGMERPELLSAIALLDRRLARFRRDPAEEPNARGRPRTIRQLSFTLEEPRNG